MNASLNATALLLVGPATDIDPKKFTFIDVHLAGVYFEILLTLARSANRKTIRYKELVEKAKDSHSHDQVVQQSAIATNIGRRLDPVNWFCRTNQLPDLAALVVGRDGTPGERYKRNNDWQAMLAAVAAFDWNAWSGAFNAYVQSVKAALPPSRVKLPTSERRSEAAARQLNWEYFQANRATFPADATLQQKEDMIALLTSGVDPIVAFDIVYNGADS